MNDSGFLALRPVPRIRGLLRPVHWVSGLTAAALLGYSVLASGLNGDIRYVLACLRSGGAAGFSPSGIFTHRPYFYRWFVAGMDSLTAGPSAAREMIIRVAGIALCLAAGIALRSALLRSLPHREATLTAVSVALALALAPQIDFLQPEWAATLLSVLAIAAAFGFEQRWVAVAVASLPLGLAVMMKYSTAATALMALLVVFAADRVRALLLGALTAVSAAALFAFSLWSGSHELQWARDMPKINQGALTRTGVHPALMAERSVSYLAERAFTSPVVALLPAALLLVLARRRGLRRRAELAVIAAAVVLVCVAAVAVQGNWFGYHSASLPVAAAALWGLAVSGWYTSFRRPPLFFLLVTALLAALAPFASLAPDRALVLDTGTAWAAGGLALLAALADLALARGVRNRRAQPAQPARPRRAVFGTVGVAVTTLVGVMCLAVPVWPSSPNLIDSRRHATLTNAQFEAREARTAASAAAVDRRLPNGAPVLYLAFGDVAYFIGHPAQCRYPIPTFLQRVKYLPDIADLPSFAENARCVSHDPAPYAVLQRSWFQLARVTPALREAVETYYDCPKATAEPERPVICRLRPRR